VKDRSLKPASSRIHTQTSGIEDRPTQAGGQTGQTGQTAPGGTASDPVLDGPGPDEDPWAPDSLHAHLVVEGRSVLGVAGEEQVVAAAYTQTGT
jgi:hypothetical protein